MNMADLPAPLVPAEVDLRGYEFMPFYGDRLFGSETWIACTAEGKVAALRLWWRAYGKETPAGSLPTSEVLLCEYAGYSAAPRVWAKIKPSVMRGWVLCSDGRLYHPFVAELAIEAYEYRNKQRNRTEKARLTRLSQSLSQTDDVGSNPSVTDSTGQDRTGQKDLLSANADPSPAAPIDCPHQKIIDLYHQHLPLSPRVASWTETRASYLRARWREMRSQKCWKSEADGLAFFERFFKYVAESKFLTGRADGRQGQKPFLADLEWLVKTSNFVKVIEGKYNQ